MNELCKHHIKSYYPNSSIVSERDKVKTGNFKITINDSLVVFDVKQNGSQELTDENIEDFINRITKVVASV